MKTAYRRGLWLLGAIVAAGVVDRFYFRPVGRYHVSPPTGNSSMVLVDTTTGHAWYYGNNEWHHVPPP